MKNKKVAAATLPTLYSTDSYGNVRSWRVWADGPDLCVEFGVKGGALQVTRKACKAKNVGRSNETTPSEQALAEAASLWQKKADQEYSTSPKGGKTILRPMLAHVFDPRHVQWPAYVQQKRDGIRSLSRWDGDEIIIESRKGKPFHFPHLVAELKKFLPKKMVLDGELYADQTSFQTITKWVKDVNHPDRHNTCIAYYDCILLDRPEATQSDRFDTLDTLATLHPSKKVYQVPTWEVQSLEDVQRLFSEFVLAGYEGAMIRNAAAPYEIEKRSYNLLKFKEFQDDEYEIVDFAEAEGRDAGTVVWICQMKDGKRFRVRPKGSLAERADWFKNAKKYFGSQLTVQHQLFTDEGVPKFPVGKSIRDYE